jgi:hypothetical protein
LDLARETLLHRKEHDLDRIDPASVETLALMLVAVVAMRTAVWLWKRRARRRSRRYSPLR